MRLRTYMKKYVLGFMFNEKFGQVVLIRKNRPEWQAGLLNGVGGHVEINDKTTQMAMAREFIEETGLATAYFQWNKFAECEFGHGQTDCFATTGNIFEVASKTDETVLCMETIPPDGDWSNRVEELQYLIPMAIQSLCSKRPMYAKLFQQ